MIKYNVTLNITNYCNYSCNYCDVIKNNKKIDKKSVAEIIKFIDLNFKFINKFKFFGGEPLSNFGSIKSILNGTEHCGIEYEIVTNTSLLNDDVGYYLERYFYLIFFSIDSQNYFDFGKIFNFINKYNLNDKLYFNLIISPGRHEVAKKQFFKLYESGFINFNILPVYYKLKWNKDDLYYFSLLMKDILDLSIKDKNIKLYGFQNNLGYNHSLINKSLFIDNDLKLYYTDFVNTRLGNKIKNELYLGDLIDYKLDGIKYLNIFQNILDNYESKINNNILGQSQLHKIMDYFSKYLNNK